MFQFVSFCAILLALCSTIRTVRCKRSETDLSESYIEAYRLTDRSRLERAVFNIATRMAKLTKEAKFIYTDGWHRVFTMRGGRKKALKDFESFEPTDVEEFPVGPRGVVRKIGRRGTVKISVDMKPNRGQTVLTIGKRVNTISLTKSDPDTIDTIIVYTSN